MHFYYERGCNFRSWIKIGDIYQATNDITCVVRDELGTHYEFHLLPGFQTDGGSVPLAFQWFVPKWSSTNDFINAAYFIHDAAYASGLIHRDIADDMLRGMLRDAGLSRFKASTVCWCVNKFAASHYGPENDSEGNGDFVKLHVYTM